MKYDYLIVGAGPFGATFAYEANKRGKKVLVIDKRNHVGGNMYCENIENINVHKYGAHIFHTSNKKVWDYVNQFCTFNNYINSPIANYKGEIYNLPFNMNTFNKKNFIISELPDSVEPFEIYLPFSTKQLEIEILSVYKGEKYEDTCLNYILAK